MSRTTAFVGIALVGCGLVGCDQMQMLNHPTSQSDQALTLYNGQGAEQNGPALGQSFASAQDKQARIGLAYVSMSGATRTSDGATFKSLHLIKGELRGTVTDGTRLAGTGFVGVTLVARGLTSTGDVDSSAAPLRKVRVVSAVAVVPGTALQDPDFYHYNILVKDPTTSAWVDPCGGGYAIAVPGFFDHRDGVTGGGAYTYGSPVQRFTLACSRTAIQKCAEGTHYKPWQLVTGPLPDSCKDVADSTCAPLWTRSGADALQTCTRLIRGDFCGDGHAMTFDGTLIDGLDNYYDDGIEPDAPDHPEWPIESQWGPGGATCVDQARVTGPINSWMSAHCPGVMRTCSATQIQAAFDNRSQPVMVNRSQRKLAIYRPEAAQPYATYGASTAAWVDSAHSQTLVAIGAPNADGVTYGNGRGAVHVFRVRQDGDYLGSRELVATLDAPAATTTGARFGLSLTFRYGPTGSGLDLYVGAPFNNSEAGAVYRYPITWNSSTPVLGAPVVVPNPQTGPIRFGRALSSSPGGRLFIGADQASCGGSYRGGVFVAEPGQQTLSDLGNPGCAAGNGHGVVLSALSDTQVLVTSGNEPNAVCAGSYGVGALRLYTRQASGAFTETWRLGLPECSLTGYPAFADNAVVVGDKLLVSASALTLAGTASTAGKVYAYQFSATTQPTRLATLDLVSSRTGRAFGVALSTYDVTVAGGTNTYLAIGEPDNGTGGGQGGQVHFYQKQASGGFTWAKSISDPMSVAGTVSGMGGSLRAAGPFLLIGATAVKVDGQNYAGGLYHFHFDASQPLP